MFVYLLMADTQLNSEVLMDNMNSAYTLILGASSTIGVAIIKKLASSRPLVLHARNRNKLDEAIKDIRFMCTPIIWIHDLSDIDGIENQFLEFLKGQSIQVESVIHCAAALYVQPLKSLKLRTMTEVYNVNVLSFMLILKTLLNRNFRQHLKSVVIISSNISNRGAKAFSLYSSTKGALDSMMRSLAIELAPRVRINSVLPGAIKTSMTEEIFENKELTDRMLRDYPLGFGYAEDIANTVEFLLSENARWITGQQITVDGGRSINISG